jgi:hypothetical protein
MAQNMEEVNNILQFSQIAQSLGPEGQMALKTGEMLDYIAEKLSVPQRIRTSREERAAMQEQATQMAEQAAMMAQSAAPEAGMPI